MIKGSDEFISKNDVKYKSNNVLKIAPNFDEMIRTN